MRRGLGILFCAALGVTAFAGETSTCAGQGRLEVAFSPGDDAGALILRAITEAKSQILVQAFSFTHRAIAEALIAAHRRGVDVEVIADRVQAHALANSLVGEIARAGVPVWLDGEHAAAHNKVMVLDPELPTATVVTGSFNFTHAAQSRNAENVLVLRGCPEIARAYAANWRRHRAHAARP